VNPLAFAETATESADAEHRRFRTSPWGEMCIVETARIWQCTGMSESEWRLFATLPDVPSAQSLAEILGAEGFTVRVSSDAGVLGQAAPSRLYVAAAQFYRAKGSMAQRQFSDEELANLSAGATAADPPDHP